MKLHYKKKKQMQSKPKSVQQRRVPILDQFHPIFQPHIVDVVDVVADDHCSYKCIVTFFGMNEDS